VLLKVFVPTCHLVHKFLPSWEKDLVSVSNHISPFMFIHILTLRSMLKAITKGVEISACGFVGDITLDSVLLLDIVAVEKVHQFYRGDFVSKGQKINIDFVGNIFIDQ
jgi:hypothetical protein